MRHRHWLLATTLTAVGIAAAGDAHASGFYNMPTSLQQCMGYGFGPGYHAPMLLGPMMKSGIAAQRIQRLPAALAPPMSAGFDTPSVWRGEPSVGYGDVPYAPNGWQSHVGGAYGGSAVAGPHQAAYPQQFQPRSAPVLNAPKSAEVVPLPAPGR